MNENKLKQHYIRLPQELEEIFRGEHFHKALNQLRSGIVVVTFLYALFGILDAQILPEMKDKTWFIRYVIVCPIGALTFLFTFTPQFKKYSQLAMFFLVIVGGTGIIAMMTIVRSPINYFHCPSDQFMITRI